MICSNAGAARENMIQHIVYAITWNISCKSRLRPDGPYGSWLAAATVIRAHGIEDLRDPGWD